jgi:hypothetical protein
MDIRGALILAYGKEIAVKKPIKTSLFKETKPTKATGRHGLKRYVGIVEFPISRGGGIAWIKSVTALRGYEARNYSVVWL